MLICYTLASNPYTIVFMAMTHHRLGESAEAESLLAKLRELVASDRWIKTRRVRCADHPVSLNHPRIHRRSWACVEHDSHSRPTSTKVRRDLM